MEEFLYFQSINLSAQIVQFDEIVDKYAALAETINPYLLVPFIENTGSTVDVLKL